MLAGISPSKTEGAVEEVDSSACSVGMEASGSFGLLRGQMGNGRGGGMVSLLRRR